MTDATLQMEVGNYLMMVFALVGLGVTAFAFMLFIASKLAKFKRGGDELH